jgi:hypothetical protein
MMFRDASNPRLVADAAQLRQHRLKRVQPLAQLLSLTAKQLNEVLGLHAITRMHWRGVAAEHRRTLTNDKSADNRY